MVRVEPGSTQMAGWLVSPCSSFSSSKTRVTVAPLCTSSAELAVCTAPPAPGVIMEQPRRMMVCVPPSISILCRFHAIVASQVPVTTCPWQPPVQSPASRLTPSCSILCVVSAKETAGRKPANIPAASTEATAFFIQFILLPPALRQKAAFAAQKDFSGMPEKSKGGPLSPNHLKSGIYFNLYTTLSYAEKQALFPQIFPAQTLAAPHSSAGPAAAFSPSARQAAAAPQRPSSASAMAARAGVPPSAPVQSCHTSCGRPQQVQK